MRKSRAFTLVELLVVISIIALLVAILLPALGRAREQARAVFCLTNMRSMSIAVVMYAEDHQDYLPAGRSHLTQGNWIGLLLPYAEDNLLYRCPSDRSKHFQTPYVHPATGQSALRNSSYGLNFYLSGSVFEYENYNSRKAIKTGRHISTIYVAELAEEDTYAVLDHFHPELWWFNYDENAEMPYLDVPDQLAYQRHSGSANYSFIDGHAERLAFSETYEIAWDISSFVDLKFYANKYDPKRSK